MIDDILQLPGTGATVTVDEPETSQVGTVMLVPPFGMSADSLFATSYVLATNGMRVLRLTPRNSPDGTSGGLRGFRLSRLHDDIVGALRTLGPDALMAISLSARPSLRALSAPGCAVRTAAFVTPVVEVRHTLTRVIGRDHFDERTAAPSHPWVNVLGHDVDYAFIADCERTGMTDLDSTLRDLRVCPTNVAFVGGTDDPWVDIGHLRTVKQEHPGITLDEVPAGTHQLYRNPVLAMRFFTAATTRLLADLTGAPAQAIAPPFAEIVARLEENRSTA